MWNQLNKEIATADSSELIRLTGSLGEMIACQHFNVHMLMHYLQYHEGLKVYQHLIAKLRRESFVNLDLYLPQICYLVLTKQTRECVHLLQKLILEVAMENSNIGLRALNLFQSWSEDVSVSTCPYSESATEFFNLLEGTLVN